MLPEFNTKTFSQIFPDLSSFTDCISTEFGGYASQILTADSLKAIYWLLYARYGENPIVNYTVSIFKAKMVSIIYAKGPSWEKRIDLQKKLRNLTDDQLMTGAKTIFNNALHPETSPGTDTGEELDYINSQNVSKHKRSYLDAYSYLQDLLKTDVTEEFISSFAKLFSRFVSPNVTRIYVNDIEEEDENE